MGRRKTSLLCVFDNINLMVDAVKTLMDDFRSDIVNFGYLQVRVDTDVDVSFDHLGPHDFARMLRADRPHHCRHGRDSINKDRKGARGGQVLHVLDLKVKGGSFDQIDRILWSAGGFQSHRPRGWFRARAKQNVQFVWGADHFSRVLKATAKRGS